VAINRKEKNMSTEEYTDVLNACRELPVAKGEYLETDFVMNLMSTVLDYQMHPTTLKNAESHFRLNRWPRIRSRDDLHGLLATYPATDEGNRAAAVYLWGYKYGNRLKQLRDLLDYFDSNSVSDQEALQWWARESSYERDFKGKIKGLGFAIYKWLVMRQGVATIKPDLHVKNFLRSITHRLFSDQEAVDTLEQAAHDLGMAANKLDWAIWEYQRGLPS
jgi:hypothetical protein